MTERLKWKAPIRFPKSVMATPACPLSTAAFTKSATTVVACSMENCVWLWRWANSTSAACKAVDLEAVVFAVSNFPRPSARFFLASSTARPMACIVEGLAVLNRLKKS